MKDLAKRLVLQNAFLTRMASRMRKWQVSRGKKIQFGKGSFIGFSSVFEGRNRLGTNTEFVSSSLGYASYIGDGSKFSRTQIGRFCSIGPNVECVFGKHPTQNYVSTHPAFFSVNHSIGFSFVKKQLFQEHPSPLDKDGKFTICIGNDVWIGANVAILDGVKIGDGAIVAANALIIKDVPPYAIVGGVPAKILRYRFPEKDVDYLLDLKWWNKPLTWIIQYGEYFNDLGILLKVLENE